MKGVAARRCSSISPGPWLGPFFHFMPGDARWNVSGWSAAPEPPTIQSGWGEQQEEAPRGAREDPGAGHLEELDLHLQQGRRARSNCWAYSEPYYAVRGVEGVVLCKVCAAARLLFAETAGKAQGGLRREQGNEIIESVILLAIDCVQKSRREAQGLPPR